MEHIQNENWILFSVLLATPNLTLETGFCLELNNTKNLKYKFLDILNNMKLTESSLSYIKKEITLGTLQNFRLFIFRKN